MVTWQRVNHFPGTYLLGRKDNMARVCNKFRRTYGAENFEYFPKTFICPGDRAELLADEDECKARAKKGEVPMWIVKPPEGCKGIGIRLVTDPSTQIKERAIVVVSRYIDNPLLINQTKFDLRLYVAVTSFNPLRVYIHEHGLGRFCTVKYTNKSRKNRFRHLTNYSLNKNNPEFKRAEGDADDEGHKWSARAVWAHLEKQGVDTAPIKDKIDGIPRLIVSRRVCVGVVCARWQEQMSSRRVLLASPCCLLLRRLHLRGARRDLVDQT
jgi:tubulin polyglutamylase TTLL4